MFKAITQVGDRQISNPLLDTRSRKALLFDLPGLEVEDYYNLGHQLDSSPA